MLVPGELSHREIDDGWLLPAPVEREAVHTRSILCRGFRRSDGLIDIDARFIDTRPFAYDSHIRGNIEAGAALHNMQIRVTIDRTRQIVAVVSAMPSTPFDSCVGVNPNFQRLVGLSISRGFRQAMRERLGGVEGCTHMLAMLEVVAAAAMQTFVSDSMASRKPGDAPGIRTFNIESLVDTCWTYKSDGEVIEQFRRRRAQAAKT